MKLTFTTVSTNEEPLYDEPVKVSDLPPKTAHLVHMWYCNVAGFNNELEEDEALEAEARRKFGGVVHSMEVVSQYDFNFTDKLTDFASAHKLDDMCILHIDFGSSHPEKVTNVLRATLKVSDAVVGTVLKASGSQDGWIVLNKKKLR